MINLTKGFLLSFRQAIAVNNFSLIFEIFLKTMPFNESFLKLSGTIVTPNLAFTKAKAV